MKYCPNPKCAKGDVWEADYLQQCSGCQTELTPCIRCLCGESTYNPRARGHSWCANFCAHCGHAWTEDYLGRCMAAQLKGMVREIAEKHDG